MRGRAALAALRRRAHRRSAGNYPVRRQSRLHVLGHGLVLAIYRTAARLRRTGRVAAAIFPQSAHRALAHTLPALGGGPPGDCGLLSQRAGRLLRLPPGRPHCPLVLSLPPQNRATGRRDAGELPALPVAYSGAGYAARTGTGDELSAVGHLAGAAADELPHATLRHPPAVRTDAGQGRLL
ncbi:MAG: hypothetical protein BWY76_03494 [bacterium ADurb.Bin429]|nr:MAG: hypothetical protein BWY76_03494 [bacterium ADurb.Bin429]